MLVTNQPTTNFAVVKIKLISLFEGLSSFTKIRSIKSLQEVIQSILLILLLIVRIRYEE